MRRFRIWGSKHDREDMERGICYDGILGLQLGAARSEESPDEGFYVIAEKNKRASFMYV
jgi:hypothetical protein